MDLGTEEPTMMSPHITTALAAERQSRYRSEAEARRASPRHRRKMFRRTTARSERS